MSYLLACANVNIATLLLWLEFDFLEIANKIVVGGVGICYHAVLHVF